MVRYSYLPEQFADPQPILDAIRDVIATGAYTLGPAVEEFEKGFAGLVGGRHAIGVNSGTDAIKLALKALGVGPGDEVITTANTFVATVGAILETGAQPVLVDCRDDYLIDPDLVEAAVTGRTKAIVPVHLSGTVADMERLCAIADQRGLHIVEDACQAILARRLDRPAGTWGMAGAFSLHPLKNLNVWGDGGVILTGNDDVADRLRMVRNHGLADRDTVALPGVNSRLDTLQAVVGNWLLPQVPEITERRIAVAERYTAAFADLAWMSPPPSVPDVRAVYHLYMLTTPHRDELLAHLVQHGVEAKIHYPIPLHLQPGFSALGYVRGDFPVAERLASTVLSLPVDQHLSDAQVDEVIDTVLRFSASE